jgi:hypothetical protein
MARARFVPSRLLSSESEVCIPDRLRDRVKELEDQVRGLSLQSSTSQHSDGPDLGLPTKEEERNLPEELDPLGQHGSNRKYYNWSFATRTTPQGSDQAYGASSTFYFVDQLASYLNAAMRHPQLEEASDSSSLPWSTLTELRDSLTGVETTTSDALSVREDLARSEEERLLQIYWDNYDVLYPILDKVDFDAYYHSLWTQASKRRSPSALIDILLAFCLQHDAIEKASTIIKNSDSPNGPTNSTAGRWFFRRCQSLLQDELQEPTVMTSQSYALSVFWLSQASWQNAAQNLLTSCLRIGVVLGLHLEPSPDLAPSIRAFRKRLWWTVYSIDAQYAMEYRRPLARNFGQVTCTLPKNDHVINAKNFTASSLNTQYIRIILATRPMYILFYQECANVLRRSGGTDMYEDLEGLESCATRLETKIVYLQIWLQDVPKCLKRSREGHGQPYSTDGSRLDLSTINRVNLWHCVLLEILYHTWVMSLFRPFIQYSQIGSRAHPLTERHAVSCPKHAITITNIIHQVIYESISMRAWHSLCVNQLRVALALVGYGVAYPRGSVATGAREALRTAIHSFNLLGWTFPRAAKAAVMLRDVVEQVDLMQTDRAAGKPLNYQYVVEVATEDPCLDQIGFDENQLGTQRDLQAYESPISGLPAAEHGDLTNFIADGDWPNLLLDFEYLGEQ